MKKQAIIRRLQQAINQLSAMDVNDIDLYASVDQGMYSEEPKEIEDLTLDFYFDRRVETDKVFLEIYLEKKI